MKHIIEGKREEGIEVTGRQGRSLKQLLDDLKETREYWKLNEEALDHTPWRTRDVHVTNSSIHDVIYQKVDIFSARL